MVSEGQQFQGSSQHNTIVERTAMRSSDCSAFIVCTSFTSHSTPNKFSSVLRLPSCRPGFDMHVHIEEALAGSLMDVNNELNKL